MVILRQELGSRRLKEEEDTKGKDQPRVDKRKQVPDRERGPEGDISGRMGWTTAAADNRDKRQTAKKNVQMNYNRENLQRLKPGDKGLLAAKNSEVVVRSGAEKEGMEKIGVRERVKETDRGAAVRGVPTGGGNVLLRPPRTAAISVTLPSGSDYTYWKALLRAKDRIDIEDLRIPEIRPRRAVTRALILEVLSEDCHSKADALAIRMTKVLAGKGVKVARPIKFAEIRLRGLDDSSTEEEVARAIVREGICLEQEVRVGKIRMSRGGMGVVWAKCPLYAVLACGKRPG